MLSKGASSTVTTRWVGVMGECDARTQGAPIVVLSGRPRTKQRAAQRVQTPRASSCSSLQSSIYLLGDELGARSSVDDDEPVGLALGELPVGAGRTRVKVVFLALDPVAVAAHATHGIVGADLEQDRAVGHQAPDGGEVELQHALETEAAGDALVGDRRVDVAVADHRRPARERGPDELLDVLGTRRRVERSLSPRSHIAAVE